MTWGRVDDLEARHPKTLALIELAGYEAYYRLHRLRQWTWAHRTDGHFSEAVAREEGVKPKHLAAMVEVRLVDRNGDGYVIHDAGHYFGKIGDTTAAARMRRYRDRKRNDGA